MCALPKTKFQKHVIPTMNSYLPNILFHKPLLSSIQLFTRHNRSSFYTRAASSTGASPAPHQQTPSTCLLSMNMAQSRSKSTATPTSFATGLLARVNASTKAAQEVRRKAALAQAEKRKRDEAKKEQEKKLRIREEADRIVQRNVPIPRAKTIKRRSAAPQPRKERRERRERISSPIRKPRPVRGPPKPLPGMEFVVRKTAKKSIKVPHASDYSDMFGEQYLAGVDLAVTKQMAKETAEAAKENKKILKEKEERRRQKVKEAEEITRKEDELRAKGLLTAKQKRKLKCAASAKDWVAIDAPVPVGTNVKDLVTRPLDTESAPKVRSEKEAEKLEAKVTEREVSMRKRQLRERVLAMAGGTQLKAAKKRAKEDDDEPRRTRRRFSDDDDDDEPVRKRISTSDSRRNGYTRKDDRRYSRDQGYNSEEWGEFDNDGDDDDDDEDLYGIEALDREEERSRRIGEIEDKMERKKEVRRLREKERKREYFERRRGYN